jgi:hypothetical protein
MKVRTCIQWNAETQTCEAEVWADPMPLGLPPLTPEEGATMGLAVFGLFFVAWLVKWLRRFASTL